MSLLLTPARQARVRDFFEKHGSKALFLARFFPGVRIGVYAYAGSQRIPWGRFLSLDAAGVLISAPLSIFVGRSAALAFSDDPHSAMAAATQRAHVVGRWVLAIAVVGLLVGILLQLVWRRGNRRD